MKDMKKAFENALYKKVVDSKWYMVYDGCSPKEFNLIDYVVANKTLVQNAFGDYALIHIDGSVSWVEWDSETGIEKPVENSPKESWINSDFWNDYRNYLPTTEECMVDLKAIYFGEVVGDKHYINELKKQGWIK